MKKLSTFKNFQIYQLTKELAEKYAADIIEALDQIPEVDKHSKEQLLSDTKGERLLYSKWQHSIIALSEEDKFAGVVIGYERKNEANEQYPVNSIYLNDFAVAKDFQKQGLGKILVEIWLTYNSELGFIDLSGPLFFSVQTNSAEWNRHVQRLYEGYGFQKISRKKYENREDNVYLLEK